MKIFNSTEDCSLSDLSALRAAVLRVDPLASLEIEYDGSSNSISIESPRVSAKIEAVPGNRWHETKRDFLAKIDLTGELLPAQFRRADARAVLSMKADDLNRYRGNGCVYAAQTAASSADTKEISNVAELGLHALFHMRQAIFYDKIGISFRKGSMLERFHESITDGVVARAFGESVENTSAELQEIADRGGRINDKYLNYLNSLGYLMPQSSIERARLWVRICRTEHETLKQLSALTEYEVDTNLEARNIMWRAFRLFLGYVLEEKRDNN